MSLKIGHEVSFVDKTSTHFKIPSSVIEINSRARLRYAFYEAQYIFVVLHSMVYALNLPDHTLPDCQLKYNTFI